mgnify:CR=1 FL=1
MSKKKTSKRKSGAAVGCADLLERIIANTKDPSLKFTMEVVKIAEHCDKLNELAVYLNYFSCTQRLMALTGGSETTLNVLEMITPTKRHAP